MLKISKEELEVEMVNSNSKEYQNIKEISTLLSLLGML